MPEQHVRELVRHHADHLTFACRGLEHAAVDEHRPAGQRERVDVLQVHRREGVLERLLLEVRGRAATSRRPSSSR